MNRPSTPDAAPAHDARDGDAALGAQLAQLRSQQSRLLSELQAGEVQVRRLARSVWRVQEDERRRIARDLHDGLGQTLSALRHRIEAVGAADAAAQADTLAAALSLCDAALQETRHLARLLRPQILDDLGLEAALRWLARSSAAQARCEIEVEIVALPDPMPSDISTLVFRVVQEALANQVRHAQARTGVVRLGLRGQHLVLLIVDDGRGCDLAAAQAAASGSRSSGLAGMRERVQLFGGTFQAISAPGEGMQIRVLIPLGELA